MQENKKFDIAKAIGFLLLFVAICVFSFTVLLVPGIREYKQQNGVYKIEYSLYLKAKELFDAENNRLASLQKTNARIITALGKATNEGTLSTLANGYFKKVNIQKIGAAQKEGGFTYDDYNVTASFDASKNMFAFLKAVEEDNAVLQVKTPLIIEGGAEGLVSNFVLRAYHAGSPKAAAK